MPENLKKIYQLNLTEDEAVILCCFWGFAATAWNSEMGCTVFQNYSEAVHQKLHQVINKLNEDGKNGAKDLVKKMYNLVAVLPE